MATDAKDSKEPVPLYDVRLMERNLRKGLLTHKDIEKYMKSLPDRKDNAAPMTDAPTQDAPK